MPVILTTIVTAITAGISTLAAGFTLGGVISFALKTAALVGLQFLLRKRTPDRPIPDVTQSQTFASGPARWVLGRARVGGVVAFATVDEEVPRTELGGESGKASDLHLVLALSEGNCDAIEAVYIGDDRFDVDFTPEGYYSRRRYKSTDTDQIVEGLGVIFKQERLAWYDRSKDAWLDTDPYNPDGDARRLDPENDDDAERIRICRLANSITIWPYLNTDTPAANRFRSVRYYTARDFNSSDGEDTLWNTETQFGKPWTAAHDLTGLAAVHIKLRQISGRDFDSRAFRSGIPQVSFLMRGQQVTYPDPATNGASNITRWTDNAAAIRYWWHRNRLDIPAEAIDTPAFIRAFNECQTTITPTTPDLFPDYPPGEKPEWAKNDNLLSFRKYSINGVLASGERPSAIESEFDDCWQGIVVEEGGKLFYYPGGVNSTEADTVDGNDLIELPTITPAPALTERVNAVSISIDQSTFHDFQNHSIRDIQDRDKQQQVDQDIYYPQSLGTLRWINNPAAAYLIGTINLKRARNTTTFSMKLPPGNIRRRDNDGTDAILTADEPIKYLKMSVGLLYSVTIPGESIEGRQMMLVEKTINPDFTVNATFVDSPSETYDGSYVLPPIDPPPRYTPSKQGARPPKPTGLAVTSKTTVADDGTFEFQVNVTADVSPLPVKFRLVAGDDIYDSPSVRDGRYTFKIVSQRQEFRITARSIDASGKESLPTLAFHTPSFANIVIARPIWSRVIPLGANLQMTFESVAYSLPISGVELRYTRVNLGSSTDPVDLTPANWTSTGKLLNTRPIQIVQGLDITVASLLEESGIYKIYARYVSPISGIAGTRGPISAPYRIEYSKPETPINTFEEAPLWPGDKWNLELYTAKAGVTEGYPLMMMAHQAPEDDPSTSGTDERKEFLNDIPLAIWNGNTADQFPSLTTPWRPAWLFGECAGYGEDLDETGRSEVTEMLLSEGDSTWYRTLPIDLGTTKPVDVFAQVSSFAPASQAISNLTFGNAAVLHQIWLPNSAIPPITLPAARSGIGTVSYTIEGVPAGVTLNAARVLSGTVSVGSATGTATLIARDAGGGEARLSFTWTIIAGVTNPIRVNTPTVTDITRTAATVSWAVITGASYYELSYTPTGGTETVQSNIFGTEFRLGGLTGGTTYSVKVRAVNAADTGNYSPTATFTTDIVLVAPPIPTGLTLTNDNGIRANWNADVLAASYLIRWKKTTEATYPVANQIPLITTNTFTIQPALTENSTAYHVQVRARNSIGLSADWSAAVQITTSAAPPAAPTISGVTDGTDATPSVLVTVSAVSGSNQTQIEVKADQPDGVYSGTPIVRTFTGNSPFEVFNVRDGFTYRFRARKRVAGNRYTDWSAEFLYVKGDVPAQISSLTITRASNSTVLTFRWPRADDPDDNAATSYRFRYWEKSTPTNILEWTYTPSAGSRVNINQTTSRSFASGRYVFQVSGCNSDGCGLPAQAEFDLASLPSPTPHAPTGLIAVAVSATEVHLNWTNNALNDRKDADTAVNYELRAQGWDGVTGITSTYYNPIDLTADSTYTFQIRAKYQNSNAWSAWVNFDAVTTEPATVSTRYTLPASTNLSLTRKSGSWGGREIDYSFTTPVTSNIGYFQIRFREATNDENGTASFSFSNRLNRSKLPDWHYFNIPNTFTTGTRTFSGEFDPMFSRCVYKVQVRAYLAANDSTLNASKGFGEWKDTNNTQTIYPYRSSSSRFSAPDTSRSRSITNLVYNNGTRTPLPVVTVQQIADGSNDFDLEFHWDAQTHLIEDPSTYQAIISVRRIQPPRQTFWQRTFTDINIEEWTNTFIFATSGQIYQYNFQLQDYSIRGDLISPQGFNGVLGEYTVQAAAVTTIANVSAVTATPENEDLLFTAAEVPEADGYEFTMLENAPNVSNTRTSHIYQSTSNRQYRKRGARNELVTASVRAYYGSGSDRIFSQTPFTRTYTGGDSDPASLHKITGLQATRDADSTDFTWNAISSSLFPNVGYQCQYSTDNGTTWQTNSSQYRTTNSFSLTNAEASLTGDVMMRVRPLQGTNLSNPTNTGRAWSTIAFKAVASNETGGGPGRIRQLVAIARNDTVHLDWTQATGTGTVEIESAAPAATPTWANLANPSNATTEWATLQSAYTDLLFRLRQMTNESDGDWTYIRYTAEMQATVGDVPSIITSATYHTISLTWGAAPNAFGYDVEYRKSGSSNWLPHITNEPNLSTTIPDLDDGSTYQIRIRGRDGDTLGDWFEDTENTLTCTGLSAPSFTFTVTGETLRVTWTAVSTATSYDIEASVGNTVHLTDNVTGTSREYTATNFPNISGTVNISIRMRSYISDCAGTYSAKQTKEYTPAAALTLSSGTYGWWPPGGGGLDPHIISGGNADGVGELDIPKNRLVISANGAGHTRCRFTIPNTITNPRTVGREYKIEISTTSNTSFINMALSDQGPSPQNQTFERLSSSLTYHWTQAVAGQLYTFDIVLNGQADNLAYPLKLKISRAEPSGTSGAIANAFGATGATINLDPDDYQISEDEPVSELIRPFFSKTPEYQIWQTGEAVDYTLPEPVGGKAPYRILASDYPGGLTFDEATRTFTGTITNPGPQTGYTTLQLIDANDNYDTVYMPWAIATTAQPGPSISSGFGLITHPFEIHCLLKGDMRGYLGNRASGGTNAADIENNVQHARGLVTWFQCPTRGAKFARLRNAASPDFDLVIKIDDEFIFSDTNDKDEFIRYSDENYIPGALIGIYKYSATTVTTGLTESSPGPITLEWGPQIDLPNETSGTVGGAIATGMGYSANEAQAAQSPEGEDETDIYALWRDGTSGNWTKQGPLPKSGNLWQPIYSSPDTPANNVRQICFEFHFKRWKNKSVQRATTGWRDS